MPRNAVSTRRYSGINILALWRALVSCGFASHIFLTFREAATLGATVRRGERGVDSQGRT
ncbi:MAG: ArdC family protein [Blastomonas sp.]|nr:ArdC family protein [Blastomonas sp.]